MVMQRGSVAGLSLAALIATAAAAQPKKETAPAPYPDKPIRFIVPFTPAGTADILARIVGQKLSERWNQQVVIDNRPGSAGILGSEIAAKAPADGHTLMMGITANIAINPALYAKLPYDASRDFAPVTLIAKAPYLMVVTPRLPVKSVQEFIAYAKARPGEVNYASTGSGSAGHLTAELFASMAGVKLVHIPYKTSAAHVVDMVSGQVHVYFGGIVSTQPHIQAGRMRARHHRRETLALDAGAADSCRVGVERIRSRRLVRRVRAGRDAAGNRGEAECGTGANTQVAGGR
jgi:tripartite-type tricarboxylate transporter receptor subunit TctC